MDRKKVDVDGYEVKCERFVDAGGPRVWFEFEFPDGTKLAIGTKRGCNHPDEVFLRTGGVVKMWSRYGSMQSDSVHNPRWLKRA